MEKIEEGHFPPKKAESELASVQVETDNPAKKLARQLDFTGGVPGQALTVSLEEHANQIIQPEVIKSTQLTVSMKSTQVISPQPQLQQHILLMPMQQAPVLPPQPLVRPWSMQSSSEAKDGTPKKPKQCNCKHSRCLKLYCECFASGIFCDGCNCANCHNNVENEASREEAVEATLERNPNAFRPKIASSPHGTREEREEAGDGLVLPKHNKGCHCKKSGCLKKYCECFQANILCSENCRCMDCKNFEGNEERQAHFHGDHANNMAYLQQAANVAITDAIGSSGYGSPPVNKNRKPQELFSGSMIKDPVHRLGQFQQENQIKASVPPSLLSSIPSTRVSNAAALGPPKPTYRSLLADIIQNHDIKELCSVLIVYAQEAAKILSDEKDASLKQAKHHRKASYPSSGVGKVVPDDCSTGIQAESIRGDESRLDGADVSAERPISPGTLALMCDEQDTTFTAAAAPPNDLTSLSNNTSSQLPHGQGRAEIMLRKYGFHLVLSGDLYKKCDQIKHAIRTYKCALSVFKGTTWRHIRDHVHFHIGKWYGFLGIFDVAIKNMLEVLACGHQSKTTQELFLKDFLQIIQQTGKTYEVPKLQLPVINIPSVKVVYEDHRTYASQAAIHVKESLWRSLEEDMIPTLSSKSNWLELQSKMLPKKLRESNICVAGEAIGITIEFKNPLQIPISISGVTLICEHSPAVSEPNANNSIGEQNGETSNKSATSGNCASDTSSFTLSEADVALGEGETVLVQLTVTPRAEGTLKIVGIRWKLSGSLGGFCTFDSDLVRKKVMKGNRKSKRSTFDNLKFLIIKSLPKLEGFIHHLPETVYVGDLRCIALELKNPSKIPVKKLKMKVSPPRFLQIGHKEDLEVQFPACLERKSSKQRSLRSKTDKVSDDIFSFPEDTSIADGTPISWPLWLRAAAPGKISLYLSVYYEMGDISSVMTYRILRVHFNIEVLPSLDVSFQISPRPSRLQEFLVQMDVVNRSSSKGFQVHQLSSVGNEWEMSLLEPTKVLPSDFLLAGQAISWFLKLKNCRSVTDQDSASSLRPSVKADVNLLCGSETVFDLYSSPLSEFHHYERVHQRISDQEHEDTVDFILVSRSQGEENDRANIFSHHICHRSVRTSSPIWWIIDGPQTVKHDFKEPFYAITLKMIVHNSSDDVVSIRCNPSDSAVNISSSGTTSAASGNEVGWHDLSLSNDVKITPDTPGTRVVKPMSSDTVPSFIWSASSSTHFTLDPLSSRETPMEICVFSPGTFDLSNYSLHWNLSSPSDQRDESRRASSGTCQGHPFYITVLQQD